VSVLEYTFSINIRQATGWAIGAATAHGKILGDKCVWSEGFAPAGSRGRAPDQGIRGEPPEAERNLVIHRSIFAEF